jgi:hypothetical protein
MPMPSQKAGWYPDPTDNKAEIYWDGARWHGRREKLSGPARTTPSPGPVQSGQSSDLRGLWRELNNRGRLLIFGGALLIVVIIGIALAAASPWESDREKECKAVATQEGYSGAQFDQVVKLCVDTQ